MSTLHSKVMQSRDTRPCSRCEKDFLSLEKISALAAEIRVEQSLAADDDIYKKRLAACKICDALREEVLCCHCGCFILIRARVSANYCPHPSGNKWEIAGNR